MTKLISIFYFSFGWQCTFECLVAPFHPLGGGSSHLPKYCFMCIWFLHFMFIFYMIKISLHSTGITFCLILAVKIVIFSWTNWDPVLLLGVLEYDNIKICVTINWHSNPRSLLFTYNVTIKISSIKNISIPNICIQAFYHL